MRLSNPNLAATFERPLPPEPSVFRWERALEWPEIDQLRRNPQAVMAALRREMAGALVKHLTENTTLLDVPDYSRRDPVFAIELTFNDRGTYERAIPQAERRGHDEGWKAAERLAEQRKPYGLDEVYE